MHVIRKIDALKSFLKAHRRRNASIGLVPTMGSLHDGHLQLVRESRSRDDLTVATIFVNPMQFNNKEDLIKYPRSEAADIEKMDQLGVEVVFVPDQSEVYPTKPQVTISMGSLETQLEGKFRPGHFQGVSLVVCKLFNYVLPDRAYFGLKDLQQFKIIERLVRDLSFPIDLIGVPTIRTKTGLALSSRNERLSEDGKRKAAKIYQGLSQAKMQLLKTNNIMEVRHDLKAFYDECEGLRFEYVSFVDPSTFSEVETFSPENAVAICVAAYVEGIRLIDNLYLRPNTDV
jgi:pantoate--beta-alanine ligase